MAHSSSRTAAAGGVHVAPYLTHVVAHHGQLTLVPPDNAGRMRKSKERTKRPKAGRQRTDESDVSVVLTGASERLSQDVRARIQDAGEVEPGPIPRPSDRTAEERRQIRQLYDSVNIPDCPPPTFQEAISTPTFPHFTVFHNGSAAAFASPYLNMPSTLSLPLTICPCAHPPPTRAASPPPSPPCNGEEPAEDDSESDSDVSNIEAIDRLSASQTRWEDDRRMGLPLHQRVERQQERYLAGGEAPGSPVATRSPPLSPLRSPLSPTSERLCEHCGAGTGESSRSNQGSRADLRASQDRAASPTDAASEAKRLASSSMSNLLSRRLLNKAKKGPSPLKVSGGPNDLSSPLSSPSSFSLSLFIPNRPSSPRPQSPTYTVKSLPPGRKRRGSIPSLRLFSSMKGKQRESVDRRGSSGSSSAEPVESWEIVDEEEAASAASHAGSSPSLEIDLCAEFPLPPDTLPTRPQSPASPTSASATQAHARSHSEPGLAKIKRALASASTLNLTLGTGTKQDVTSRPFRGQPTVTDVPRSSSIRKLGTMRDRPVPPLSDAKEAPKRRPPPPPPPHRHAMTPPASPKSLRPQASNAMRLDSPVPAAQQSGPSQRRPASPPASPVSPQQSPSLRSESPAMSTSTKRGKPPPPPPPRRAAHKQPMPNPADIEVASPTSSPSDSYRPWVCRSVNTETGAMEGASSRSETYIPTLPSSLNFASGAGDIQTAAVTDASAPFSLTLTRSADPREPDDRETFPPTPVAPTGVSMQTGSRYIEDLRPPSPASPVMLHYSQFPPLVSTMAGPEQRRSPPSGLGHYSAASSSAAPQAFSVPSSPVSQRSGRHHYPGRPLPVPPSVQSPITGAFPISVKDVGPWREEKVAPGPSSQNASPSPGPRSSDVFSAPPPSYRPNINRSTSTLDQASSSSSSVREEPAPAPNVTANRGLAPPAGSRPAAEYVPYTDLDVLLDRLEIRDGGDGGSYEVRTASSESRSVRGPTNSSTQDLLLLSDLVGPARSGSSNASAEKENTPLLGRIDLERRRVTKDGRVKLKLTLAGVPVDKCGICLSQFKEAQWAALGAECQHAFHEKCLRPWLARKQTCPMCRSSLSLGSS
ncbi:hypothetical protein GLOTRDRAFT_140727 [Gloeophyllum trabeum ATCC 11539]|uniref:RING-type domain-containing protein n=1 Tax=Gloeophyllum trabeum (strain ATCC 11539 / FP-39264 / Madison 617) TaxID=670483 RepID=S7PYG6_GLOTA|nr:uncharacterized protein GLOTRDRAFT_140727 [Gloeophyllum trabeum ATCC 11539]EPQ52392.1 hypothetical protein GLOTRDRAFT_140727 [Gloeophyllum trabeum ATCC 11539]